MGYDRISDIVHFYLNTFFLIGSISTPVSQDLYGPHCDAHPLLICHTNEYTLPCYDGYCVLGCQAVFSTSYSCYPTYCAITPQI